MLNFISRHPVIFPVRCKQSPIPNAQIVFTDGSANGKASIVTKNHQKVLETWETSGQRAEITAVIEAFAMFADVSHVGERRLRQTQHGWFGPRPWGSDGVRTESGGGYLCSPQSSCPCMELRHQVPPGETWGPRGLRESDGLSWGPEGLRGNDGPSWGPRGSVEQRARGPVALRGGQVL